MCFLGTHFVFGYFLSILLKFWSNVYTAFFSFNCIFTYGDLNKITTFLAPHPKHGMGNPAMQPHCRGCRVADLVVRAAMQNPQSQTHTHLHIHTHIKSGSQHTIGVLSKLLPFYTFGLLILFSRWHSYRLAPNYSNVCDILLGCIHFRLITLQTSGMMILGKIITWIFTTTHSCEIRNWYESMNPTCSSRDPKTHVAVLHVLNKSLLWPCPFHVDAQKKVPMQRLSVTPSHMMWVPCMWGSHPMRYKYRCIENFIVDTHVDISTWLLQLATQATLSLSLTEYTHTLSVLSL